jgi:hypothetical protein
MSFRSVIYQSAKIIFPLKTPSRPPSPQSPAYPSALLCHHLFAFRSMDHVLTILQPLTQFQVYEGLFQFFSVVLPVVFLIRLHNGGAVFD